MKEHSTVMNLPGEDRVRASTDPEINERNDQRLEQRIRFYATQDKETISERIAALDREWDIERALETTAASFTLTGTLLGLMSSRRGLVLPVIVSGFLLNHALKGWCPPLPVLRRAGLRTRIEIERERYALKLLRGDFASAENGPQGSDPKSIVRTIQC